MSSQSGGGRWSAVSLSIVIGVLLEVLLVAMLLVWLRMLPIGPSIGLAFILIVMLRVLIACFAYALAWYWHSPVPPDRKITAWGLVTLVVAETGSFLLLFFLLHPFEPLLNRHDPGGRSVPAHVPVILVHGFFSNAGFWWCLKRWLRQERVESVYTLNLDPPFADIEHYADQLAQRVDAVLQHSAQQQVLLVAHSMGGLVCRDYLRRYGSQNVKRLLTFGTPYQGTVHAALVPGPNLKQMRRGSEWLRELNTHMPDIQVTTVFSYHDTVVAPQESATFAGAKREAWAGLGHLSMAFSRKVKKRILTEVRSTQPHMDVQ